MAPVIPSTAVTPALPSLLIWPPSRWPAPDKELWRIAQAGHGPDGPDNPAAGWRPRTLEKNEDGYGRYLSWLDREGLLLDGETPAGRITPERVKAYIAQIQTHLATVSVGLTVGALNAAANAFAPQADWSWLSKRYSRLKMRAEPSREKRKIIQHTLDLYNYGKRLMETADQGPGQAIRAAQRYQAGLIIALLAARPLRIRNFQDITIGESLRWDSRNYWLTFADSKTYQPIDEPCPQDLLPYLDEFLRGRRLILLQQAAKFGSADPLHRRLWVDRVGKPMRENTLRDTIKSYTAAEFGEPLWPHLFRDCLLTSVATDRPDLMGISARLLGHTTLKTGEKHYNQACTLDASRRYGLAILNLRETFLDAIRAEQRAPAR